MKASKMAGLLGCLVMLGQPAYAQETAKFEKIRDLSPDKKFALRVSCSSEPEDAENIDPALITALELVSLPAKQVVASLGESNGGFALVWSTDSQWCAFYSSAGPRAGDTSVYRLRGNKFVPAETEGLRVDIKGDVRNEYVRPLRWLKPGTLLLEQYAIFRDEAGDAKVQFTARFDDNGKFRVINKKKVATKTKEEN